MTRVGGALQDACGSLSALHLVTSPNTQEAINAVTAPATMEIVILTMQQALSALHRQAAYLCLISTSSASRT